MADANINQGGTVPAFIRTLEQTGMLKLQSKRMDLHAARSQFLTDGYCCLENVIPTERVDEIRENVARDVWANSWLERPTGYVPGFLRVNQSLAPYLASEPVLGLVRSFFGPHVRISMLTGTVN